MSCTQHNPCYEPECGSCNPVNPCYDNCGCLNPTTFECITNIKQNYTHIPFNINQNGHDFLLQLNATINGLKENQFKVRADDSDTCPDSLFDKIEAGNENITLEVTGSGCNRKLVISAGEDIGSAGVDRYVKISANDTTSDYLTNKIVNGTYVKKTVLNPGSDEELRLDISIADLISGDSGNQLIQGNDGKLKTSFSAPDGSETKVSVAQGQGLTISGAGTSADPYVLGSTGSNFPLRSYFNGVWRNLTFSNNGEANISVSSQNVQFRYRWDGTIEFRGSVTYSVQFTTANKRIIAVAAQFPANGSTNVTSAELNRVVNLKNYMTFDTPTTIGAPNLIGYNVNMLAAASNQNANIQIEFMHNVAATKSIVITFDGCQYHPALV